MQEGDYVVRKGSTGPVGKIESFMHGGTKAVVYWGTQDRNRFAHMLSIDDLELLKEEVLG